MTLLALEFHSKFRTRPEIITLAWAAGVQEISDDNKKHTGPRTVLFMLSSWKILLPACLRRVDFSRWLCDIQKSFSLCTYFVSFFLVCFGAFVAASWDNVSTVRPHVTAGDTLNEFSRIWISRNFAELCLYILLMVIIGRQWRTLIIKICTCLRAHLQHKLHEPSQNIYRRVECFE